MLYSKRFNPPFCGLDQNIKFKTFGADIGNHII